MISLNLPKNRPVYLSQKVDARLKGLLCLDMDTRVDIPTNDERHCNCNTSFRRLSTTYPTTHSRPRTFPNTPFLTIPPPPINVEGAQPIPSTVSDSPTLFQEPSATSHGCLVPIFPVIRFRRRSVPRCQQLWIYQFPRLLNAMQVISLQNS